MLTLSASGYVSGKPKVESGDYGDSITVSLRCKGGSGKHMFYVNARFIGKRMAVIEKYMDDGDLVSVSGSVNSAVEKTKKDGTKYTSVYLNGFDFSLPARQQDDANGGLGARRVSAPAASDDEIPF